MSLAQEGRFYEFTITNDQNLSYDIVILRPGQVPVSVYPPSSTTYRAELISFNRNILYTTYFSFTTEVIVENFDFETDQISGRVIAINTTNVTMSIPYFSNGKQINIYKGNTKLLEIPVLQFADTCGDSICQEHESYESCKTDCRSGSADNYCDAVQDNICDPDCLVTQDPDCQIRLSKTSKLKIIIISAGTGIVILVTILIFNRIRKRTEYEKLKQI